MNGIDEDGLDELRFKHAIGEEALKDSWMTPEERRLIMADMARIENFIRRIEDEGYVMTADDYESLGMEPRGKARVH